MNKEQLYTVISYSRRFKGNLTTAEIILVHQHMHQGLQLSSKLENKINNINKLIQSKKWKRPITRLNSELQEEQLNPETGTYQIVK